MISGTVEFVELKYNRCVIYHLLNKNDFFYYIDKLDFNIPIIKCEVYLCAKLILCGPEVWFILGHMGVCMKPYEALRIHVYVNDEVAQKNLKLRVYRLGNQIIEIE